MERYFRNLKKKIAVKNYVQKYVAGIRFLMENGHDVNIKNISQNVICKRESQEFKEKIAKYLDKKHVYGFSSLMFAATNEDLEMAMLSIKNEIDINKKDDLGYTALMYACRFNNDADFVKMLLGNNADITIATQDGRTAIDFARDNKNVEVINTLCGTDRKPDDTILKVEQYLGMSDKITAIDEVLLSVEDKIQRDRMQQFLLSVRDEIQQVRIQQLNNNTVIIDPIKDYDNYSEYISHKEFINLEVPILYNYITKDKMYLPEKPIKGVKVPTQEEYKMRQKYDISNKISCLLQQMKQKEKLKRDLKFNDNDVMNFTATQRYLDIK